jgi:hypothetical protein
MAVRLASSMGPIWDEEDEGRLVGIAHLRQSLEELGQQPEQKRGVDLRRSNELLRGEHVDDAASLSVCLHEIVDVEHRLAEEVVAALLLDFEQAALNRAHTSR